MTYIRVQIEDLRKNSISTTYGYLQRHVDPLTGVLKASKNFGSLRFAFRFKTKEDAERHIEKHYPDDSYFAYRKNTKVAIFKYTYSTK
jgi:hypothetical protein